MSTLLAFTLALFAVQAQTVREPDPIPFAPTAALTGAQGCPYAITAEDGGADGNWTVIGNPDNTTGEWCEANGAVGAQGWLPMHTPECSPDAAPEDCPPPASRVRARNDTVTLIVSGTHTSGATAGAAVVVDFSAWQPDEEE